MHLLRQGEDMGSPVDETWEEFADRILEEVRREREERMARRKRRERAVKVAALWLVALLGAVLAWWGRKGE